MKTIDLSQSKNIQIIVNQILALKAVKQHQCANITDLYDAYVYDNKAWVITECAPEDRFLDVIIRYSWDKIREDQISYITHEASPPFCWPV
jgi:serine/threonine protein kinase